MPSLETSFFDRLSTRYAGGISVSGIALTFTGYAQVRFWLACQPRIGLLATRKRVSWIKETQLVRFFIHFYLIRYI